MKKGEAYFNWIFIMVVGVVFLTFFTGFAMKYKDLQEKKTEMILLNNIDTSFTNLQSSSFTTSTNLELPIEMNVNCNKNGYDFSIKGNNHVSYLLASEKNLKNKIYVWYQPYKVPFRLTEFYYLMDEERLKINTNNVPLVNSLKEDMPEEFKSRISVYDGSDLRIEGDENQGTVLVEGKSIPYLGKEMLYATVFSSNYSCFYDNFVQRINTALSIYEKKSILLARNGCNYNLI